MDGEDIATDWCGGLAEGSVVLSELGANCADDTSSVLNFVRRKLLNGTLQVFDTSTFTSMGNPLIQCVADVDYDLNFQPDTAVIINGVYMESYFRSAPYFDLTNIDGIVLLDVAY